MTVVAPDLFINTTGFAPGQLNAAALVPANGGPFTQGSQINTAGLLTSTGSGNITFNGLLQATGSVVFFSAGSGVITGSGINVGQFAVAGSGGSATLIGSISGDSSTAAGEKAFIFPMPSNSYRFNGCALGSVSCVLLPTLTPVQLRADQHLRRAGRPAGGRRCRRAADQHFRREPAVR